ncbi:MAG: hypothetical protein ABFS43_04215 [Thermodesulfobacteriota bacterium]
MLKEYDLALDLKGREIFRLFKRLFDAEKLLHLHPHWFIEEIKEDREGVKTRIKDHATETHFNIRFALVISELSGMSLDFKNESLHNITLFNKNGRLYASVSGETSEQELDQHYSLSLWLRSIREYIRLFIKTTPNTLFFRFIMDHAVLKMNPSQRKISLMILRFTALEILVIVLIVIGYVIFM